MRGTAPARAVARIAWRDIVRNRGRSLLIAVLVAVPVAAGVGGFTVFRTTDVTPEERATSTMGQADLVLTDIEPAPSTAELRDLLPTGTVVEAVDTSAVLVGTDGGALTVTRRSLDPDGLAEGMLEVQSGRAPVAADEVAASPAVLDGAGVEVGEQLLVDGRRLDVVGEVVDPERLSSRVVLAPPPGAEPSGARSWLVAAPPGIGADEVLDELGGFTVWSATSREDGAARGTGETVALVLLGGLGLVEAALVASAAFAVSTRRRQRELGLLAATGGAPVHLRRAVLLTGVGLGAIGAVAGAAVALAGVQLVSPWLQGWADRTIDGVVLAPSATLALVLLGVVSATAAAWVPARAAARLPVRVALSGRRPPTTPSRRGLTMGVMLVAAGVALVLAAAPASTEDADLATGLLLAGSVASVLGFGMMSPWFLEQVGRLAPRLPIGTRLAVRDTARFRTRNGPAVTAVLAGLALSVALGTGLASLEAHDAAAHQPLLRQEDLLVWGPMADTVADEVATALDATTVVQISQPMSAEGGSYDVGPSEGAGMGMDLALGDAALVRAMGGDDAAVAALDDGRAVWFGDPADAPTALALHVDSPTEARDLGVDLDVHVVPAELGSALPDAVVRQEGLRAVGLEATPGDHEWLVRLASPVSGEQAATAEAVANGALDTTVLREEGYQSSTTGLARAVLAGAVVTGLVILAVALALAAAETRSDQRTLLAVGADPRLRRSIAAGRAGVLGGLGGLLAIPAGLLPVMGLLRAASDVALVVPWASLAVVGLGTPLLAVIGAWLLARPAPDWSAAAAGPG